MALYSEREQEISVIRQQEISVIQMRSGNGNTVAKLEAMLHEDPVNHIYQLDRSAGQGYQHLFDASQGMVFVPLSRNGQDCDRQLHVCQIGQIDW